MKTLSNVIPIEEVESKIPRGPDYTRIWDGLVDIFDGEKIMWFSVVPGESCNFERLPSEVQAILIELTKDWEHKGYFGIYLGW